MKNFTKHLVIRPARPEKVYAVITEYDAPALHDWMRRGVERYGWIVVTETTERGYAAMIEEYERAHRA